MDFLNCHWDQATFLIFSNNVYDPLIYYSHLLPLVSSLILGIFVFLSDKKSIKNILFFLLTLLFSIWVYFDLILWATGNMEFEMFFWAIMLPVEFGIFFVTFLLTKKFISFDKKIKNIYKWIFGLFFTPILFLLQSGSALTAFDYTNCDRGAIEGPLWKYLYAIEVIIFIIILGEIIYALIKDKENRKKIAIYSIGVVSFLGLFIIGNVTIVQDMSWGYEQYKLFGMLIFLTILVFLIVRFKTFNTKLIGAQALVWLLVIAIGSEFFYYNQMSTYTFVITAITLILSTIMGTMIVRSVKKEVKLREELEVANANQESLIHFISHQLKGFFTKSKMIFAGILEEDFGPMSTDLKDVAKEGLLSDNNAVTLIQNVLGASNYKKGSMTYTMREVDFADVVRGACASFSREIDDKGLKIKTNLPMGPLIILADRVQIIQVVKNLLDNSIKYTPAGEIEVSLKNEMIDNVPQVILEINDTGIGLSEKDKSRLFTEGGKGEESLRYNTNSTGYGLYIVKKIIENHDGKIWAESEGRGKGAKFFVVLPRK